MHPPQVKIVCDSISPTGIRLTSFQLKYWRPIHSELMTHRVFSRNAGSSRARPSATIIRQVYEDPWGPNFWGMNQSGMQAREELTGTAKVLAPLEWRKAARNAAGFAETLVRLKVHKQIVNRLLEPFTFIDVLVTATEFNNWFVLRDHPDAQPEIQELAQLMKTAREDSIPAELDYGQWHLPYINDTDRLIVRHIAENEQANINILCKISAARCARISYKTFEGTYPSVDQDLELYNNLLVKQPLHASPAEHQATPDHHVLGKWSCPDLHGNFVGWIQHRKTLANEYVAG